VDGFFDTYQLAALAAFLLLFIGRTVVMRWREGINPITLAAGKAGLRRLAEAFLPVGLGAFVAAIALASFDIGLVSPLDDSVVDHVVARTAGAVLVAMGIFLFALALASFGASWRVGIDEEHPGGLVTGGIFRFTRNPIFVFLDAYFVGTFLINGTMFFLLAAALGLVLIHYQILQEERFLEGQYGDAYREYKRTAPRYLPVPFPASGSGSRRPAGV
jgi:protein-S-isoprenylcysteine O-methyltransferase Ste14